MIFASRQVLDFFPISPAMLKPGTRLRDFLGAVYDTGVRQQYAAKQPGGSLSREDWLSQKIASHWRERFETIERHGIDRWIRLVKRRLPSGYGVSVISNISEEKKREEQWRSDLERVQLTEDILDNLPFPLFVKDRNLTYVAANIAFCEKYQTTVDEVLGRKSGDLFSPEVAKRFEESDRHVLETGEMSVVRQRQVSRDGSERDIVSRKHRIGKPGRYFLVSTMQDLPRDGADLDEFDRATAITTSSHHSLSPGLRAAERRYRAPRTGRDGGDRSGEFFRPQDPGRHRRPRRRNGARCARWRNTASKPAPFAARMRRSASSKSPPRPASRWIF